MSHHFARSQIFTYTHTSSIDREATVVVIVTGKGRKDQEVKKK